MSANSGRMIVLNGASSAGKTWTAQALAPLLHPGCICTGLDDILDRVQPFGAEATNTILRSLRILWFQATDGRLRLFKQLHREVVQHAQNGHDVIVETALMDTRALQDAAVCFAPLKSWFIGLKPPLEVSEAWERERDDRPIGQARRHYDLIHAHNTYDLLLDTSTMTPQACAAAILQRISAAPPDAFRRLQIATP
jgi:chloramphenicol 3-O phosphotransferase